MNDYKKCTLKDIAGALGALFIVKPLFGLDFCRNICVLS